MQSTTGSMGMRHMQARSGFGHVHVLLGSQECSQFCQSAKRLDCCCPCS